MRVIIAQLDIDPQAGDAFLTYMATYIDKRRAEQGNVGFHLTAHLDQPARFTMVEQWADDDAFGREEHERVGRARSLELRQPPAVLREPLEQREPLGARIALEPVEQALGGEVDRRFGAHRLSVREAGVRRRAQNHPS